MTEKPNAVDDFDAARDAYDAARNVYKVAHAVEKAAFIAAVDAAVDTYNAATAPAGDALDAALATFEAARNALVLLAICACISGARREQAWEAMKRSDDNES